MADESKKDGNGKGPHVINPKPFDVQSKGLFGVPTAFMDVAERVVNGELSRDDGKVAAQALEGVARSVKSNVDALKFFDKASSTDMRKMAAMLLGIGSEQLKIEQKEEPKT